MIQHTTQRDFDGTVDRRRMARYSCSGHAQITCLPLNGALLRGRLRDLGLGGCCIESIETNSPPDLDTKTEILVQVNSWFFRAMAVVRAVRDRSGISVEFMRMSAGGYTMLTDLIADLERPGPVAHSRRRPRPATWSPLRASLNPTNPAQLREGTAVSNRGIAIVGTIVPPQSADETDASRQAWLRHLHPGATSLDVFV
jgi:PilZ domain